MSISPFIINNLNEQIKALLLQFPEIADDEQLLMDMLEGSTELHQVVQKLFNHIAESEMLTSAIADRAKKLADRKSRMEKNAAMGRLLIHNIMTATGVKKLDVVEAKISVVNSPDKVVITDENVIPEQYIKITREPDKLAIKKALNEGLLIDGATLSNGGTTILIRR